MKGRNASLRREPSVAIADPTIDHCHTKEYNSEPSLSYQSMTVTDQRSAITIVLQSTTVTTNEICLEQMPCENSIKVAQHEGKE
jgi:hypothetical protein